MAEAFEAEVKITTDEAVRNLRDLEKELGEVSEGMEGASSSGSNFAQNLTAGVLAGQAAIGMLSKLKDAVTGAANEFERQAGIMNRFSGDVSEAARRTNGLITQIDLMTAQSRASAAGLELTSSQFATLSVRAAEFAAQTGGDATESLNRLMQALATGRSGALREYGVELEGITDMAEKQDSAIRQLTRGYEDSESSADTLGGMLQVLTNRMEDTQTEMIQAVNDSGLLERGMESLSTAAGVLFDELDDTNSGLSLSQELAISGAAAFAALAEQVEHYARVMSAASNAISDPLDISRWERLDAIEDPGSMIDRIGQLTMEGRAAAMAGGNRDTGAGMLAFDPNDDRPGGGGGRGRRRQSASVEGPATEVKAKEELLQRMAEQEAAEVRLLENQTSKAQVTAELVKAERERLDLMNAQSEALREQKDKAQEIAEAREEQIDLERRVKRAQEMSMAGLEGIAEVTQKTIQLSEDGAMSTKEAFRTAVDEWLKQLAIEQAWKGAAATVEAIGAAVMNQPHAAAKAAQAAGHFAIAAAAGGASAAIPNAASPGGGAEATRPTPAGGNDGGGGNGGTIVVNFNAPTSEAQIGRQQGRAERAANRRFGT